MKKSCATFRSFRHLLLAGTFVMTLLSIGVLAQAPGKHPAYLHALSNLRAARGYLSSVTGSEAVTKECAQAIAQIDGAISELKKASIDDGKNLNDHPPVEANLPKDKRLKNAMDLLNKAHADAAGEEDDAAARPLQSRILGHIDAAHRNIDQALAAK